MVYISNTSVYTVLVTINFQCAYEWFKTLRQERHNENVKMKHYNSNVL